MLIEYGAFTDEDFDLFFKSALKSLVEDCKTCNYHPKLVEIRKFTKSGVKKLKNSKNEGKQARRDDALQLVEEMLKLYEGLPDSLVGIVDEYAFNIFNYR